MLQYSLGIEKDYSRWCLVELSYFNIKNYLKLPVSCGAHTSYIKKKVEWIFLCCTFRDRVRGKPSQLKSTTSLHTGFLYQTQIQFTECRYVSDSNTLFSQ